MLMRMLRDVFLGRRLGGRAYAAFVADVAAPAQVAPDSALSSNQAGFRLRTMMAARGIAQAMPAWLIPPALAAEPGRFDEFGVPAVIFVSKFLMGRMAEQPHVYGAILDRIAERPGVPAVADMTDDFTAMPVNDDDARMADFFRRWQMGLTQRCHIVATTDALRAMVVPHAPWGVSVIEDPYEWECLGKWRAPSQDPVRLCWYGYTAAQTHPPVERAFTSILRRFPLQSFEIEFVTAARWELIKDTTARLGAHHPRTTFTLTHWSLQATWDALERCDFVLLPHDVTQEWVRAKSHNRLVAAIAAGRLALASPIPAYAELREGAWVSEDLAAGLEWALANPQAAGERVRRGQSVVEPRFSPAAVQAKWRALLLGSMRERAPVLASNG